MIDESAGWTTKGPPRSAALNSARQKCGILMMFAGLASPDLAIAMIEMRNK